MFEFCVGFLLQSRKDLHTFLCIFEIIIIINVLQGLKYSAESSA